MGANDYQVAGSHYQADVQHWDMVVQVLDNRYLEGQITKYITRWRSKNGLQDLRKAMHYAQKLYEEVQAGRVTYRAWNPRWNLCLADFAPPFKALASYTGKFPLQRFFEANKMGPEEREITTRLILWMSDRDIKVILRLLDCMIAQAEAEATPSYVQQD